MFTSNTRSHSAGVRSRKATGEAHPGHVDQGRDRWKAAGGVLDRVDGRVDGGFVGDVDAESEGGHAVGVGHLRRDGGGAVRVDVEDGDGPSVLGEPVRGGAADAAR